MSKEFPPRAEKPAFYLEQGDTFISAVYRLINRVGSGQTRIRSSKSPLADIPLIPWEIFITNDRGGDNDVSLNT